MYSYALFVGAALWIFSELLEFINAGFSPITITLVALSYLFITVGLTDLWKAPHAGVLSRGAALCFALGMLILGVFYLGSTGSALSDDTDLPGSMMFMTGAIIAFCGITTLAVWIVTRSAYPKWTGVLMIAGPVVSLTSITIFPFLMPLQPLSNLAMAFALGYLALANISGQAEAEEDAAP